MVTFTWTSPDPLDGSAKTRSIYMTELQDAVNTRRAEISQAPLSFIDQSVGKTFRFDAVEELKTVTNQLALDFGYVDGVEDSELLGRPYVTITIKYGKPVCHYPIINDLRMVLYILEVQIRIDVLLNGIVENPAIVNKNENVSLHPLDATMNITHEYMPIDFFNRPTYTSAVATDGKYLYKTTHSAYLVKEDTDIGLVIKTSIVANYSLGDLCIDENYVWVMGRRTDMPSPYYTIFKKDKNTLNTVEQYDDVHASSVMTGDKDYIFLVGNLPTPAPATYNQATIIKYDKTSDFTSYTEARINAGLGSIPPASGGEPFTSINDISIDANYIYGAYYEWNGSYGIPVQVSQSYAIVKIDKNSLAVAGVIDAHVREGAVAFTTALYHQDAGITVSNNYIYVYPYKLNVTPLHFAVIGKGGGVLFSSQSIDGRALIWNGSYPGQHNERDLTNREEYSSVL